MLSGDLNAGMGLIEQAVNLSPTLPSGYALAQALGYLRMGLYQKASDAIVELRPNANFVHWAIAAAVHGKAGRHDHARQAVEELLTLYSDFAGWAWLELERRSIAPELASALVSGWREAGLDIPASPDAGSGLGTSQ